MTQPKTPDFWHPQIESETRSDGSVLVWRADPLGDYPRTLTERLLHWAATAPDRVWMAEPGPQDQWIETTYVQAARAVQGIGATLLAQGLSAERPLIILSGNSTAHALMALGAQHVGIPSAALAPAYALASDEYGKLHDIAAQLTPGMIFADDAARYGRAIKSVFSPAVPLITCTGPLADRMHIDFTDAINARPNRSVQQAHDAVGPDTIAKFLFTSGTTGSPKAVIQTHRMLCANQAMIANCYPFMAAEPPVVIDWAPWNHTASGNKVFNMVLYNGGTFYVDDGRPTPRDIGKSIRNLACVSPTWYFNVPLGYQMLLDAMERDPALRTTFFRRLKVMMYAGAGMSQPVWDRITRIADSATHGHPPLLCTGFGATETGPFALMCTERQSAAGNLGIPGPGVTLKLVPHGDKYEARIKSPSVTPGYWRAPDVTEQAFDEEGFYCFGDAFRFVDSTRPAAGFYFDGRLAENFKLASGTWVAVGALRAKLTDDLKGLASDVVIAGEGHLNLGALVIPDWAALRDIARAPDLDRFALLDHPRVRRVAKDLLDAHAAKATGSARRVTRIMFLESPLDFDSGEVTDKGSVNQRAVLRNRADLVDNLWSEDPRVIVLGHQRS